VANSRILRELNVSGHFIQPAASDDGTSLGAALAVKHMVYNDDSSSALHSPFLGPCSEEAAIQSLLENCPSEVRSFNSFDKTALETAKLLNQGLVVGWYQGRSEWGPRALGNRSILASPTHKDMKDIINKKIKRRESFRPFAPSVLEEDVGIFFEQAVSSPFMMHVVKFKDEMYEKFPSVVHVDGTGRVQTVTSDFNPKYYRLLQEIKKLTGFGILLNTSFNENEPIVSYAEEALDCFYRTDMDVLVLNNIIIAK
jgi:carbamoyltransferase